MGHKLTAFVNLCVGNDLLLAKQGLVEVTTHLDRVFRLLEALELLGLHPLNREGELKRLLAKPNCTRNFARFGQGMGVGPATSLAKPFAVAQRWL